MIQEEDSRAIFFLFCHGISGQGNGGRKFICGYLLKDTYLFLFYIYFCL